MTKKFDDLCESILLEFRDHMIGKTVSIVATKEELPPDFPYDYGHQMKVIDFIDNNGEDAIYLLKAPDGREFELTTDLFQLHNVGTPAISATPYKHRRIREV